MNTEEFCKCPACSRSLVFDIRAFALRCPGCDASYNIKEFDEDLLTKQPPRNGGKDAAPAFIPERSHSLQPAPAARALSGGPPAPQKASCRIS